MPDTFADAHIAYPIDTAFTYRIPEGMEVKTGCRIIVPFGSNEITGYTVSVHRQKPDGFEVKDVLSLIDEEPIFDEKLIDLCRFTAESYCSYTGESLAMALPAGKKATDRHRASQPAEHTGRRGRLTREQNLIAGKISDSVSAGRFVHCLFGITGSGKTEIYIEMAERTMAAGKSVIYLVPEISLSSQIYERLYSVFGSELTMYHSGLSANERLHSWQNFYTGKSRIAVGTRSSVFLQPPDLGLIIIDEEHDASFKERSAPRYNARRLAMYRSKKEGAALIVGSATPSIETLYAAQDGLIELHRLTTRYGKAALPSIEIVRSPAKSSADNIISTMLKLKTKQAIDSGNQAIYLLNRRGFAPIVLCDKCGEILQCPDCSISLNLHKGGDMLCHYCGYKTKMPRGCPKCGSSPLSKLGTGTQRAEDIVAKTFPASRVMRLDQDSSRKKGSVFDIIDGMLNKEIDILLGTQMVAKGFDFPDVSVVGVLMADIGLNIPDFRSAERIFSLLVQVAG
ncbi:MAG: primosomal protein N', partial [Leptospirales bacterium]|nr:primosomal protein N' [Leptospirales bacterium]